MATEPTDPPADGRPNQDDEVAQQPGGKYAALAEFLGDEGLGDYVAAGGQLTDPLVLQLFNIE